MDTLNPFIASEFTPAFSENFMSLYRFTECCWWLKSAVLMELASFAGWNLWAQYHFSALCLRFHVAAEMIWGEGTNPLFPGHSRAFLALCSKLSGAKLIFPWDCFSFVPQGSQSWPMSEGCQAVLVLLAGLEHKTSPASFFSYQVRSG